MLYWTGVECGGVHVLQGRAKQQGLIDSVNMKVQKKKRRGAMHWQTARCIWQNARRLATWQMAGRILELCCGGTQLAVTVTLEAQL